MIIYCIEDINDLKYVGKTTQKLTIRKNKHKSDKYCRNDCSSARLHLEHSIIYPLEECEEENAREREQYWINKIDCVNEYKLNGENLQNSRMRNLKNYYDNRDKINSRRKELRKLRNESLK